MSRIRIVVENVPNRAEAVFRIHQVTGQSIADIQRCIESRTAVIEYLLFMNDHDEVAARLRQLLAVLTQAKATFHIYEFDSGNVDGMPDSASEIDVNIVENILSSHEQGIANRQNLEELGHH